MKKMLPAASLYIKLSLPPPRRTHAGPEDQRKIMQAEESSLNRACTKAATVACQVEVHLANPKQKIAVSLKQLKQDTREHHWGDCQQPTLQAVPQNAKTIVIILLQSNNNTWSLQCKSKSSRINDTVTWKWYLSSDCLCKGGGSV